MDPAVPLERTGDNTSPDHVYATLDDCYVKAGWRRWRIEVSAIVDDAARRRRLIQLTLNGEPSYMLTLSLPEFAISRDAIHALSGWLTNPEPSQSVLNVVSIPPASHRRLAV